MKFKSYDMRRGGYGGPCWLCRRIDAGSGFLDGNFWSPRVVWTCDRHGKEIYDMATKVSLPEFHRIEQAALLDAGNKAGEYLDSINKTDLAQLDQVEWVTFLKTVITGFGDHIEKHLEEVPF